jgi:N-acetyltransferase 10
MFIFILFIFILFYLFLFLATLQTETIKPRKKLPPLLAQLSERPPEKLHYMGVSYGVTLQLYRFWSKLAFLPLCI